MFLSLLQRLGFLVLLIGSMAASFTSEAQCEPWSSWMQRKPKQDAFESQISMARLSERHGQPETAQKIYLAILEKQPDNQLAHHRLAVMAAKNGDFEQADQHFATAVKSGPATPELLGDLGYTLLMQNRLEEAEKSLRETISQFPNYKSAHNSLGMTLGAMGKKDQALAEFRQVVGEAEAHANLAFVMAQAGKLEESSQHYHQALKIDNQLRPAAEALVQLSPHLPAQSAAMMPKFNSPTAASQSAQSAAKPAAATLPGPAQGMSSTRAYTADKNAGLILDTSVEPASMNQPADNATSAANAKAADGRLAANPIPAVAEPVAPGSPQIPTFAEVSFPPAVADLAKPEQHADPSQQAVPVRLQQPNLLAQVQATLPSNTDGNAAAAPAARIHAQVFDYPPTSAIASDEPVSQSVEPPAFTAPSAQAINAARAMADQAEQQAGSSWANASPIATQAPQYRTEAAPAAFTTSAGLGHAVAGGADNSRMKFKPAAAESEGLTLTPMMLGMIGTTFCLLVCGSAIWMIARRGSQPQAANGQINQQGGSFNFDATRGELELRIRETLAGHTSQLLEQAGPQSTPAKKYRLPGSVPLGSASRISYRTTY